MSNPFLKKNPLMSLWLSGFHRAACAARGQAAAQAKRQGTAAAAQTGQALGELWARSIGLAPSRPAARPTKTAKPRKKRR